MAMWGTKHTTNATKLIDLHHRIIEAIEIAGGGAYWLGSHDGELKIFSMDGKSTLEISPYQGEEEPEDDTETGSEDSGAT